MNTIELMRQRLASLEPEALEIGDDSALHTGHEGAKSGGGHYNLTIVSPQFDGKLTVARHRMIYNSLGDLMQTRIHALSILAFAPGEL
ncbi:MAG: BolA family protein [Sulfurimicrobium sp.]